VGVPVHDDRALFEFLILEGAQAGLSWSTILRKRDHYRRAFDNFDPRKIARYDAAKRRRLLGDFRDCGAIALKSVQRLTMPMRFFGYKKNSAVSTPICGVSSMGVPSRIGGARGTPLPADTYESEALSQDLKRRGFRFVGPTICYAFMQAVGMVNDHTIDCFRHRHLARQYRHVGKDVRLPPSAVSILRETLNISM